MTRFTAPLGLLFFAVLGWPLSSATLNFLVVETGPLRESPAGPLPAAPFEASALWETCLLDVFFEAGHVVSNSPILRLAGIGAADLPGRDRPSGEFPAGEFPGEIRLELEGAILGGADYLILVLLSYPPGTDPRTKPEVVNMRIYSLRSGGAGGRTLTDFVYEGGASLGPASEARPEGGVGPAGGELERDRAKRLIRGLIPHIKD